jgi:peptide/nickel transport system substrate-binding protein
VSQLDKRSPEVVLDPNPNYWNPARKPTSRIVFDNIISKAHAIKSVESGDGKVDVVTQLLPGEAQAFKGGDHAKLMVNDAKTALVGVFNENKPDSPWKDIALRKAVNTAIDRGAYGLTMKAD